MSLRHLRAQVHDPALRAKLTPSFQFGCKRILISDDYWASFERENVELVTEPIEEITRDGIADARRRAPRGRRDRARDRLRASASRRAPFPIVGPRRPTPRRGVGATAPSPTRA